MIDNTQFYTKYRSRVFCVLSLWRIDYISRNLFFSGCMESIRSRQPIRTPYQVIWQIIFHSVHSQCSLKGVRPTIMGNFLALISGVFSDLRSPEIRTIYYGTAKSSSFLLSIPINRGGEKSKSFQNWRQFWAVSAASIINNRNWDLLELCVLLVPGMIRLRTPSAV